MSTAKGALTVVRLSTTAGYLARASLEFSSGLNCIVGARGTCKSTVVEMLRFAFDAEPDKVSKLIASTTSHTESSDGLIATALGGGTVACEVRAETEDRVVVERDIGREPQVFIEDVEQSDAREWLGRIEIYSQGDLQRLADKPAECLSLIDRRFEKRAREIASQRTHIREQLADIGRRMRILRAEHSAKSDRCARLPALQAELVELQSARPPLSLELARERDLHLGRQRVAAKLREVLDARAKLARGAGALEQNITTFASGSSILKELDGPEAALLRADFDEVAHALSVLRQQVSEHGQALEAAFARIVARQESLSARYHQLRREQDVVNESLRKDETLRAEIQKLMLEDAERVRIEQELARLGAERAKLRSDIEGLVAELKGHREAQIVGIETAFGQQIVVGLRPRSDVGQVRDALREMLKGSNLRSQEDVAEALSIATEGSELIDAIETSDAALLSKISKRDASQTAKLMSFLADHPRLHELDGLMWEDVLEIEMLVHGVSKPMSELSRGQRATALLPLILRQAAHPLVFDQPEDDLDNAYITQALMEGIKTVKLQRQLIFVTHNANIPVLGDAERVIVMEMCGPAEAASRAGSVTDMREDIIALLEGGREAFRRRGDRYGYHQHPDESGAVQS